MKFGLLCDDPAAGPLLAALEQHPDHTLMLAVLVSPQTDPLLAALSGVRCVNRWEELLTANELEAVIVGGTATEVWDGARQLAAADIPLLVFPNLAAGESILYELSLIRDDRHVCLFPAWRHRFDPVIRQLQAAWQASERPEISYVQWERGITTAGSDPLTNQVIDDTLLRDADLLRYLCGEVDQVTSLRTGETAAGTAMQTVKLAGRSLPETNWSIKPATTDVSQITFQTATGPLRLSWKSLENGWKLDNETVAAESSAEAQLLDGFAASVTHGEHDSAWNDVLKGVEIVDGARRSLERRRTIELHHERLSERAIFKTQMAAIGCGVLMLTLVLMLGYLAIAAVVPLHGVALKVMRALVFAPLFVFLLLQFLLPLTRPAK